MNKLVDAYYESLNDIAPVYADPKDAVIDLDARCTMLEEKLASLEQLVRQQALNMLSMAERLHEMHAKVTNTSRPAIMLPDGFDPRGH